MLYARRGLRASLLLRGASGFGVKHHLRTDRLLTLSEDLPLVALAVDRPEAILAAADEVAARSPETGLITLERAVHRRRPPAPRRRGRSSPSISGAERGPQGGRRTSRS